MKAVFLFALGFAALYPAKAVLADEGSIRVAVSVDVTAEGRNFIRPTPDKPVLYLPVVSGDKDRGAILSYYQRTPPTVARVSDQLAKAFADRGYRLPAAPSAAAIVLDFQWGYVAPETVTTGRFKRGLGLNRIAGIRSGKWIANWPEVATYIIGERWPDYATSAIGNLADPQTQELFDALRDAGGEPEVQGARYYLLVSAFAARAYLQNQPVLLWRAHISTEYWGHYLDEVLPTLIDTAVLSSGRETNTPHMITVPLAGWEPLSPTRAAQLTDNPVAAPGIKS